MIDVYKYIKDNNIGIEPLMTAVTDVEFRAIISVLNIDIAVEIGTFHGATAAYIAQFANKVHTFDIIDYHNQRMWKDLGLEDKIVYHLVKDKEEIKQILSTIEFDFAFIDDGHEYEDTKADFELVKHCGRILFHDVNHPSLFPGVRKFTDELGNVRIVGNNGYWEDNNGSNTWINK